MIGIYKITNNKNGKAYIGQSIHCEERFKEHLYGKLLIDKAIQFDGIENFTFEILKEVKKSELDEWEDYYIEKYDTMYPNGYNRKWNRPYKIIFSKASSSLSQSNIIDQKQIEEGDVFIMLAWKDFLNATSELSYSAMKLYMYLAKNMDGYEFYLSSKDYTSAFGVTDRTYRNAKAELIQKGYLREEEGKKIIFNTQGIFKETYKSLSDELIKVGDQLRLIDEDAYQDLFAKLKEADLKTITDENLKKLKVKELISYGTEAIKQLTKQSLDGYL